MPELGFFEAKAASQKEPSAFFAGQKITGKWAAV